jgi:hypothetical protein
MVALVLGKKPWRPLVTECNFNEIIYGMASSLDRHHNDCDRNSDTTEVASIVLQEC